MARNRGSRRTVVLLASALVMLAVTTGAAGAARLQTDCDERPVGIGCERSSTTGPGEEPTDTTYPEDDEATDTTAGGGEELGGTSTPSADGASAGVDGDRGEAPTAVGDSSGSDDGGGTSPLMLGGVLLLGLGAGTAGGAALMASRRRSAVAPVAAMPPGPPVDAATAGDRRRLVQALIDVRDQVSSEALRASIGAALTEVGVVELSVAAGTVFDPQVHKGVDRVVTDDPGLDRTVAETERPGYADRGTTVRLPEVVVRRLDTPEAAR